MNPDQTPPQDAPAESPSSGANVYYINQEFKFGRETFAVTDGQSTVYVAKRKMMAIKEHIDVYNDESASQVVFTIQQTSMISMSRSYEVVSANGQKIGTFTLKEMQSMMKEHWDVSDGRGNVIGAVEQDGMQAMLGRLSGIVPQSFTVTINNQPVCVYREEMNMGMWFKMDIDFSGDSAGTFDKTLGIAGAILLASRHMNTK